MSPPNWAARVYRLRRLPHHITDATEAARLLGEALDIPPDDVVVYSVAHTFNRLESPPSKVATLQLKSSPSSLQLDDGKDEWKVPLPGTLDHLLLDTHFLGMTVLNHVDAHSHHTEYALTFSKLLLHMLSTIIHSAALPSPVWQVTLLDPGSLTGTTRLLCGSGMKPQG
jgi:hypothetical protein